MAASDNPRKNGPQIFINGRFLSQALTGVQRYASEIVLAADRILASGREPEALRSCQWVLLAPPDAKYELPLKTIITRKAGRFTGHAWDQLDLAWQARGKPLISLANSGPVGHRRHTVVIHDAQVFEHPEFFAPRYARVHRALGRALAVTASIGTVSDFSRDELARVLGLASADIHVCPNSAEHFQAVVPDRGVVARLGLDGRPFFVAIGPMKKNKNVRLAIDALSLLGRDDAVLVVVGDHEQGVFGASTLAAHERVVFAGRLSDGELAALYAHAAAFLFPSLYEGFGVPPLEAMIFGCPVIVSDIPALREVCGDAAAYCDPADARDLAQRMRERLAAGPISDAERQRQRARMDLYTWEASAMKLMHRVSQIYFRPAMSSRFSYSDTPA